MAHVNSFTAASLRRRGLFLAGAPFLLGLGLVGSPLAQSAPRPHQPPGPHPAMRHLGPASPEIMRDSIGVTGAKLDQYTRRYQTYMAQTRPARDSLQAAMRSLRNDYQKGDRTASRNEHQAIRKEAETLRKRDQQFEASVKDILSKDQQKRYAAYKENQIKLAREWRHQNRRKATFSDSARS
jgi:hypothetical protein